MTCRGPAATVPALRKCTILTLPPSSISSPQHSSCRLWSSPEVSSTCAHRHPTLCTCGRTTEPTATLSVTRGRDSRTRISHTTVDRERGRVACSESTMNYTGYTCVAMTIDSCVHVYVLCYKWVLCVINVLLFYIQLYKIILLRLVSVKVMTLISNSWNHFRPGQYIGRLSAQSNTSFQFSVLLFPVSIYNCSHLYT